MAGNLVPCRAAAGRHCDGAERLLWSLLPDLIPLGGRRQLRCYRRQFAGGRRRRAQAVLLRANLWKIGYGENPKPYRAAAGSYGRELLEDGGEGLKLQPWQIALGVALTVGALAYIGHIAKDVRPFPCPPDL